MGCGQLPWQFSDGYEPFERCKYSLLESCVQRGLNRQTIDHLAFANGWRDFDWGSVIFSDEASISSDCESRRYVYREPGTRYDTCYIQRRERLGRFSLSRWGWMSRAGVGVLERIHGRFNAPQYQHIFENVMLRSVRVRNPGGNLIFQQDNHLVRCSMGVQRWFARRPEIELIPWPPKSPDLNVVEHMWAKLKEGRILRYGNNPPRNPQQLWDQVVELWDNLAQDNDYCLTLVDSIPRRCQSVIDAGGMWTRN